MGAAQIPTSNQKNQRIVLRRVAEGIVNSHADSFSMRLVLLTLVTLLFTVSVGPVSPVWSAVLLVLLNRISVPVWNLARDEDDQARPWRTRKIISKGAIDYLKSVIFPMS